MDNVTTGSTYKGYPSKEITPSFWTGLRESLVAILLKIKLNFLSVSL